MALSLHSFYIPVMGTGFTVDTPLKVARFNISSVISLVDDVLIEQIRAYWCKKSGREYTPIEQRDVDHRAKRIRSYLALVRELVDEQIKKLKTESFEAASDLVKYFELLPLSSKVSQLYHQMKQNGDAAQKLAQQEELRKWVQPGRIETNIMTKLDVPQFNQGAALPYQYNDAAAALRGFATSTGGDSIVLSAGFNGALYNYITEFDAFYPDQTGHFAKEICLKVSDYRSMLIQGRYLAKHGLWVSEYRLESPLNCGGHAFVNDGSLMGEVLQQVSKHRDQLLEELFGLYQASLLKKKGINLTEIPKTRVTAQGGVGTAAEHQFLLNHYHLDAVGWGSPFLLVPEATNVDETTLKQLVNATGEDIYLSRSSPIGIQFWNLKNSGSEQKRVERINAGQPGSPCPKGYTRVFQDSEGKPICFASRQYQQKRVQELDSLINQSTDETEKTQLLAKREEVLNKSCICNDLAGAALLKLGISKQVYPAICPGPNLRYFSKVSTLCEMVKHIYGQFDLLANTVRNNIFANELALQIASLSNDLARAKLSLDCRSHKELTSVIQKLLSGIEYYRQLINQFPAELKQNFFEFLDNTAQRIEQLSNELEVAKTPC